MRRAFLAAATALLLGGAQAPAPARTGEAPVLHAAPDFTLRDQNGVRVHLSGARGRKVVLVFYRGYW